MKAHPTSPICTTMASAPGSTGTTKAFQILQLPRLESDDDDLMEIVDRYKAFRLFALSSAPEAFSATYNQEMGFPAERWTQRLQNENAIQFIATAVDTVSTAKDDREALKQERWIGMVVLECKQESGEKASYYHEIVKPNSDDNSNPLHEQENLSMLTISYHMNAVFVVPGFRRSGLGGQLLGKCFEHVAAETRCKGISCAKIETLVDSWNKEAIRLYEANDFRILGSSEYMVDKSKRHAISMVRLVQIIGV